MDRESPSRQMAQAVRETIVATGGRVPPTLLAQMTALVETVTQELLADPAFAHELDRRPQERLGRLR